MTNNESEINTIAEQTVNLSESATDERLLRYFVERGLGQFIPQLLKDGVRHISKEEVLKLGRGIWDAKQKQYVAVDGIALPFTSDWYQIRFCEPIEVNGKSIKCLSPKGPAQGLNTDALFITEGWADAKAGEYIFGADIGALTGLSHARKLLKSGSKQIIIPDSDFFSNPHVFMGAIAAAIHTGGKIMILPKMGGHPKGGLSECVLLGYKKEDFEKWGKNSLTPKEALLIWPNYFKDEIPDKKISIAIDYALRLAAEHLDESEQEILIERINENLSLSKRLLKQKLAKFKDIVDAKNFEQQFLQALKAGSTPPARVSKKTPTPVEYGLELLPLYENHHQFDLQQKTWRKYNPSTGAWEAKDDAEIEGIITDESLKRGVKFADLSFIKKTCDFLKNRLRIECWHQQPRSSFVNFKNCVLDVSTGQTFPHDPKFGFTSCLERDYYLIENLPADPIAALQQNAPYFYQYASDSMGGNERKIKKLLAVIAGVLKFKFSELQMFVHLIGPQGTGKSVFAKLLCELIGQRNTEATSIAALTGNTSSYELANIINKQLVIAADEDSVSKNLGVIKKLVGADLINYRPITKSPASGRFLGTLLVTSNYPIFCTSKSSGLDRRLCLIEFPNQVPVERRNSNLEQLIKTELSIITLIALSLQDSEIAELIKGTGEGSVIDFRLKEWEMKCRSNSVAAWMNDWLIEAPGERVPVGRLYESYKEKASEAGERNQLKRESLSVALQEICRDILHWNVKSGRTCQYRYIEGIRLRTEADTATPFIEDLIASDNGVTAHDSPMTASMTASNQDSVTIMTGMTAKLEDFTDSEKNNSETQSEAVPAEENIFISDFPENPSDELSYPSPPCQGKGLRPSSDLSSACHGAVIGLSPAQAEHLAKIKDALKVAKTYDEYKELVKPPLSSKAERKAVQDCLSQEEIAAIKTLQHEKKPCYERGVPNAAIWHIVRWIDAQMVRVKTGNAFLDLHQSRIVF